MPEIAKEDEPAGKTKWTPEVEAEQKAGWGRINESMIAQFKTLPILIEGVKEPILNFELPEESKSAIMKNAIDYVISNQLEANEANIRAVAQAMYSDIQDSNRSKIYHAIFERGRSITAEEYLKKYSNPSGKNTDTPPGGSEELSDDAKAKRVYDAEMQR
jgi:hypothetical protein